MGAIKLPKNSIDFFKSNQDKIFISGNLAEGPWNEKLGEKIKSICNVKNAIPVNSNGSGLVALLLIYKEYYDMQDMPVIHTCWQQQDNILHKKEKDNFERARVFNQSYIDHVGKQVNHQNNKIEQDPQDIADAN